VRRPLQDAAPLPPQAAARLPPRVLAAEHGGDLCGARAQQLRSVGGARVGRGPVVRPLVVPRAVGRAGERGHQRALLGQRVLPEPARGRAHLSAAAVCNRMVYQCSGVRKATGAVRRTPQLGALGIPLAMRRQLGGRRGGGRCAVSCTGAAGARESTSIAPALAPNML